MRNDNVSISSIFVDQIISGFEATVLTPSEFESARQKYSSYGDSGDTLGQRVRINVTKSLHFRFAQNPEKFSRLYQNYITNSDDTNHSLEKFINLRKNFEIESLVDNPIQLEALGNGEYQVIDGFHRLSLYCWKTGKTYIPHKYLSGLLTSEINLKPERTSRKLRKALSKTHDNGFYNSWAIGNDFEAGYHGFDLFGFKIEGQRDNLKRVTNLLLSENLNERRILDLGCNSGGFIFHLPIVEYALGLDFDKNSIKFANLLKKYISEFDPELAHRYEFWQQDLNKLSTADLTEIIVKKRINLVLLLSMGSWLNNWEKIYATVASSGLDILLETNNDVQGINELQFFKEFGYRCDLILGSSQDDNSGNLGRKTYLCTSLS